jgi:hypothetical protein
MDQSEPEVYKRLRRLERESSYTRLAIVVLIVALLGFALSDHPKVTLAAQVSDEIDTKKLVIKDTQGSDRIVLSVLAPDNNDPNGPAYFAVKGSGQWFVVQAAATEATWSLGGVGGPGGGILAAVSSPSAAPFPKGTWANRLSLTSPDQGTLNLTSGQVTVSGPAPCTGWNNLQPPSITASGFSGRTWSAPGWPVVPCPH